MWAFLLLFVLNVFFVGKLFIALPTDSPDGKSSDEQPAVQTLDEEPYVLNMQVDTNQAEEMANDYLKGINLADTQLTISLTDRLEVQGYYQVLGKDWPFSIYFIPTATDHGRVILKVDDFSIARISLPVEVVMSILAQQLSLPDWIIMDSRSQSIELCFDQVVFDNKAQVRMKNIDLQADQIQFDLLLNKSILQGQEA